VSTEPIDIHRKKASVATLSVVSNATLVLLKLIVGIAIGSIAVVSEAIHSGVDLLASIIALFAVRLSAKPADEEHPFGHGKVENLSGTIEAVLIFLAAGWIIFEAIRKIIHPQELSMTHLGIGVMFVSAAANLFVSQMLFKVGKETESVALLADGWHLRTDVYTSAGVMLGLAVIMVGKSWFPNSDLQLVDPVAAIAVALLIIKAAYDLTVDSGKDLLDAKLPEAEEAVIIHAIKQESSIAGYHDLRTRKAGSARFVVVHIQVSPGMPTLQSHDITERIEQRIIERIPHAAVTIHVEPCDGDCPPCPAECGDRKPAGAKPS
jgi:cation diffusion facilitator family transporter